MMSDIRSMVREVLLEELGRLKSERQTGPRRERVSIGNSDELNAFVLKVLGMARRRDLAAELRSGSLRFELEDNAIGRQPLPRQTSAPPGASFDRGLVTEKQIAKLDRGSRISVGRSVCFTPLAKDEIRRRGIKIERTAK